ncbi:MAG TPA: ParA family protein [Thermodesulfovibrionales bacterium]|nr:ParA family protein [Thermodesulfovibrionales bacterium]
MAKTIAIVNQKGGVGKTTTAINLGASLALAEKDILLIDTDPQGNSTSGLGINREEVRRSLYDAYAEKCTPGEAVVQTSVQHLSLIPSVVDLLGVEVELVGREGRERILSRIIEGLEEKYKYILIDCPPSLGLLCLNALVAADSVIVPVQCEYYALEGLSLLTRTLHRVRNSFNPSLEIRGILLTMFDTRNSLSHQVAEEVKHHFGGKVFDTVIPRNVSLAEAPSHGKPIMLYDARSIGAQSYLSLAKEILSENGSR